MLPPIATEADATQLGITATQQALTRASIRIRGWLHQQITIGQSTITATGPTVRLPQRPVASVASVTLDGAAIAYTLKAGVVTVDTDAEVRITYTHGFVAVPDEILELVCQVASRMSAEPAALQQGIQQATNGPFSVGYGWDAWKAQSGLTAGEKATLRRYWPELPRTIPVGRG